MKEKKNLLRDEGMHAGATPDKFAFAASLRESPTPQEEKLWKFLKLKPKGFKFRRQHPFNQYILDFYCHRAQLVIELDGKQHKSNMEYDNDRTAILEEYGLKVVRFENSKINNDFGKVKERILELLQSGK